MLVPKTVSVTGLFDGEVAGDAVAIIQKTSTRWSETYITEELATEGDTATTPYINEFPTINAATDGIVVNVSIRE